MIVDLADGVIVRERVRHAIEARLPEGGEWRAMLSSSAPCAWQAVVAAATALASEMVAFMSDRDLEAVRLALIEGARHAA